MALVFASVCQAQQITLGAKPGMAFFYNVTSNWSSADSYAAIPPDLVLVNKTSCIEIRIGEVNFPHVSISSISYYLNGTTDFERGNVNLNSGEGYGFVGLIGSNLKVGDRIHPNGEDTLTVLGTTTRTYGDSTRTINHVSIVDNNPEEGYKASRDLYFDQETGILVEQIDKTETTMSPITVSSLTWKIAYVVGVDGWSIPGFSMPTAPLPQPSNTGIGTITKWHLLIVAVVLLIIALAILIYKKKLVKHE
jgi:hypothetical protein